MKDTTAGFSRSLVLGLFVFGLTAQSAIGQESKSAALAKELAQLLDQAKLDSAAAHDPSAPDLFVAALYFPGSQLLVVSAKYTVPQLLTEKLGKKEYREVYIDLNSASVPASKIFISDLNGDGLKAKREDNQPFDTIEMAGKTTAFDGEWKKQKLSEDEYLKVFTTADQAYAKMLQALLAQIKKTS